MVHRDESCPLAVMTQVSTAQIGLETGLSLSVMALLDVGTSLPVWETATGSWYDHAAGGSRDRSRICMYRPALLGFALFSFVQGIELCRGRGSADTRG